MAEHQKLAARPRDVLGKKVKQLRRDGVVPGVLYGPTVAEPVSIAVDAREFDQVYRTAGGSSLVDLAVDGSSHPVFIRSVQRDPLKQIVLNVEFYAPNPRQPTTANVPLALVGELDRPLDGVITLVLQTVEVRGLPEAMPSQLEVDVSVLDGERHAIRVADLALPPGIEILTAADEIVAQVQAAETAEDVTAPEPAEDLAEEIGDQPAAINEGVPPIEES